MNLYSVFDKKGCCYDLVFLASGDADAIRTCDTMVFSRESQFSQYPEDFDLYCVGSFDSRTGVCESSLSRFVMNFQDRVVFSEVQRRIFEDKVKTLKEKSLCREVDHA